MLDCAYKYPLPAVTGCDGVLLTSPEVALSKTSGIVDIAGPRGLPGVRFAGGEYITLKDSPCLSFGKSGQDFSVSMWLKASAGSSEIMRSGITQFGGQKGFVLYTKPSGGRTVLELQTNDASADTTSRFVDSIPFDAGSWVRVTVTFLDNGDSGYGTITVNGQTTSGDLHGSPYNQSIQFGNYSQFGGPVPVEVADFRSYGRVLNSTEVRAQWIDAAPYFQLSAADLRNSISLLSSHFQGTSTLSPDALASTISKFQKNSTFLPTSETIILESLALLDRYETNAGPFFMQSDTANGILAAPQAGESPSITQARQMLPVFQTVFDEVYRGESVATCRDRLRGRRWKTADHFPGKVTSMVDPNQSFSIRVNASVPAAWGIPVAYAKNPKLRPTGLYLPPGSIGRIVVPPALVNKGFVVQVGAHNADHSTKWIFKRLPRVVRRFEILQSETFVTSPLGGGIYIEVPYLADAGLVDVQVQGVVEAPMFSTRAMNPTTLSEWQRRRNLGVPWADFVSDSYMVQVPTNWVYAKSDPSQFLNSWTTAVNTFSEFVGIPPEKRNDVVLYAQADVMIRHGAYGIGYPQVNNVYDPLQSAYGDSRNALVSDPMTNDAEFHELGHAQLFSKFRGETEALVNFPYVYIASTKFGYTFDDAFRLSMGKTQFTPDRAAVDWMVTVNFGNGAEMDYSNTTRDEFRYQQRGYAKYADIARLFGWKALIDFYYQENLDYMAKVPSDGLNAVDSRILRLSVAAGVDLTPLIHFWGIRPVDPATLRARIAAKGLPRSLLVRDLLLRYRGLIPADQAAFLTFFNTVYPGMPAGDSPDYGPGWYQVRKNQWDATTAQKARSVIDALIATYYP